MPPRHGIWRKLPLAAIAADVDRLADHAGAAVTAMASTTQHGLLGAIDRLIAAVIAVLQSAEHHTVIVQRGITRDTWLRAAAHRTGADAGVLLAAATRLADMPAVTAWFRQGDPPLDRFPRSAGPPDPTTAWLPRLAISRPSGPPGRAAAATGGSPPDGVVRPPQG